VWRHAKAWRRTAAWRRRAGDDRRRPGDVVLAAGCVVWVMAESSCDAIWGKLIARFLSNRCVRWLSVRGCFSANDGGNLGR
jgi:hypothetical protein